MATEALGLFPPDGPDGAGAHAAPPRRRRRSRSVLALVLSLVLLLVLAAAGTAAWYAWRTSKAVAEIPRETLLPTSGPRPSGVPTPTRGGQAKPQVWALIGVDKANGGASRSDVLMTAYLPADRKNVYVLSYPRDLWVPVPGHGEAKINAAYAYGGAPLTVQTLEGLLGVRVDHTAVIDFAGYVALTEAMGGVQVNNKVAGAWGGYTFPQGPLIVSGAQALAYVRERSDLPGGDLDRNERQRAVTRAIMTKALSQDVLSNPARFAEVMGRLKGFVALDQDASDSLLRDTALGLKMTGAGDIVSLSAPVGPPGWTPDGQWIFTRDEAALGELAAAMRDDRMGAYASAHTTDRPPTLRTPTPTPTPR